MPLSLRPLTRAIHDRIVGPAVNNSWQNRSNLTFHPPDISFILIARLWRHTAAGRSASSVRQASARESISMPLAEETVTFMSTDPLSADFGLRPVTLADRPA